MLPPCDWLPFAPAPFALFVKHTRLQYLNPYHFDAASFMIDYVARCHAPAAAPDFSTPKRMAYVPAIKLDHLRPRLRRLRGLDGAVWQAGRAWAQFQSGHFHPYGGDSGGDRRHCVSAGRMAESGHN